MSIETVARTTKVSTDVSGMCEHCEFSISSDDLPGAINHYISEHGYRLLHVGTETTHDSEHQPWHTTIAVLGTDQPPPIREIPTLDEWLKP